MMQTQAGPRNARHVWVWDLELADVIARRIFRAYPWTVTALASSRMPGYRRLRKENKRRLLGLVRKAINDHVRESGESAE